MIFNLLFHNNINEIELDEQIQNRLFYDLLQFNNENHEKYFFDKSPSLRNFVVIVYISSLINLYLCVVSPPGEGKTTAARAIARIRKKILQINSIEPFYLHTFHSTTKTNYFFGSTIIIDSK